MRASGGRDKTRQEACRLRWTILPLLAALAFSLNIDDAGANEPAAAPRLTIAVLDLDQVPAFAPRPRVSDRPEWRTSFGSERETEVRYDAPRALAPLADFSSIDVVLIHGVQAAAPLRRLFPPRDWRLIVSRKILSATDPVGFRTVRSDLPPATAIAVKARGDLRVTARLQALNLDTPAAARAGEPSVATAVRLIARDGRAVWLAAINLPAACSAEDPPCTALTALDTWRTEMRNRGEPTVIGSRIARQTTSTDDEKLAAACASQAIESDLSWDYVTKQKADFSDGPSMSCISVVEITDDGPFP